jgi:hypothetical protein
MERDKSGEGDLGGDGAGDVRDGRWGLRIARGGVVPGDKAAGDGDEMVREPMGRTMFGRWEKATDVAMDPVDGTFDTSIMSISQSLLSSLLNSSSSSSESG